MKTLLLSATVAGFSLLASPVSGYAQTACFGCYNQQYQAPNLGLPYNPPQSSYNPPPPPPAYQQYVPQQMRMPSYAQPYGR